MLVAVDSQWRLDQRHRAKILRLANAYFEQSNVDLLIATTANKAAGRIFKHFGADKIP